MTGRMMRRLENPEAGPSWSISGQGSYAPYPNYKDSGIEWLGEIPVHWEVKRLKLLADVRISNVNKKTITGQATVKLCNYVDVYYNETIHSDFRFMEATATQDQIRRFSLCAGDVLITKDSEDWADIAVPSVVAEDLPSVLCGYHLAQIRPNYDCEGSFLSRAFESISLRGQYHVAANGITRFGLTNNVIRDSIFVIPPLSEQRAIATFIDREVAKIDTLIEKQERLINLLQERRIALISHAVSKGLDSDVPMKDSGIEWLGRVPAHWAVTHIKRLLLENDSGVWGSDFDDGGVIILRSTEQTVSGEWDISTPAKRRLTALEHKFYRLEEGDLLVTTSSGSAMHIGKTTIVTGGVADLDCCFSNFMQRLRVKENIFPRFIWRFFNGRRRHLDYLAGTTTGLANLSGKIIEGMAIALPPLSEQRTIATFLDRETEKIDSLITKINQVIKLQKELRSTLISTAVTGKIDVRQTSVSTA